MHNLRAFIHSKRRTLAWCLALLAVFVLSSALPAPLAFPLGSAHAQGEIDTVYVLTFAGPVTPILERYLDQAIRDAQRNNAAAVILQLDTPGGSVEVTHKIIQRMLASPVPLVVYVAPAGARAGSAGTFITLAAHVAAMTPASSIGAASPVDLGGGDVDSTMAAKITNILSADIENLARRRGEAATAWAIAAVQDAAAATATEALELGVIDIIATDLNDLLSQLEGRNIQLPDGPHVLHLRDPILVDHAMNPLQRALNLLVDPTIAAILFSLGVIALMVEIRTPGFNVAGILGVVCLLLAFYGLGQLDATLTGITFMLIAVALFVAEAFTPSFGILTAAGVVAFLVAGALLYDTPGIRTPWVTLIVLAVLLGGLALLVSYLALRAQRRPAMTGSEALIGAIGTTKAAFRAGEIGSVFVYGEWWNARLEHGEVAANVPVRVTGRERMTITVTPLTDDATAAGAQPDPQLTSTDDPQ